MATHTIQIFTWLLACLALATTRSIRSLEPANYKPPCNCEQVHITDPASDQYLPPTLQHNNLAAQENEAATERNLREYLPPDTAAEAQAGGSVGEIQARQEILPGNNEYIPPNGQPGLDPQAGGDIQNRQELPNNNEQISSDIAAETDKAQAGRNAGEIQARQELPENNEQISSDIAAEAEKDQAGRNAGEIQARQEVMPGNNEYLPPSTDAPVTEAPLAVRLEDGSSQSEAIAKGEEASVEACVNGQCEEKHNENEPIGYSYPKPDVSFQLPIVEIARTGEVPQEPQTDRQKREVVRTSAAAVASASGPANAAATASASDSGTAQATATASGSKAKREAAKISSVSTDPSSGPVRISTIPFFLTRNRQERAEIDDLTRTRRETDSPKAQTLPAKIGTAQTLPAKIGTAQTLPGKVRRDQPTAQTLPAKIGTAQTLPAKIGTAQTLPGKVRRDQPTAQTLPAKIGTAQTLPAKIGTAQTLPGKVRRDTKRDQPTAQTLPAKIGTAQTLPAKIGTAQTLPGKVRRDQPTAQTLPAKVGTAQTLPAKIGTAQTLPGKVRRDTKRDQPTAQTLPAKIGTAQTLPAKIGTAQTLPGKQ